MNIKFIVAIVKAITHDMLPVSRSPGEKKRKKREKPNNK
jgi:hypothetical protein